METEGYARPRRAGRPGITERCRPIVIGFRVGLDEERTPGMPDSSSGITPEDEQNFRKLAGHHITTGFPLGAQKMQANIRHIKKNQGRAGQQALTVVN
jgi:hypothetical protein